MQMDDLKQFRQWGSITPGHPENFVTPGIEVTTGTPCLGFSALAKIHACVPLCDLCAGAWFLVLTPTLPKVALARDQSAAILPEPRQHRLLQRFAVSTASKIQAGWRLGALGCAIALCRLWQGLCPAAGN